jgi:hypothetical protein
LGKIKNVPNHQPDDVAMMFLCFQGQWTNFSVWRRSQQKVQKLCQEVKLNFKAL